MPRKVSKRDKMRAVSVAISEINLDRIDLFVEQFNKRVKSDKTRELNRSLFISSLLEMTFSNEVFFGLLKQVLLFSDTTVKEIDNAIVNIFGEKENEHLEKTLDKIREEALKL
jgi:hypothetical protein